MAILSSLPNVLLIIFGFGMLIFIHELGHFLAAKWANIRTEAFAIGMGPVLCSWRRGIGFTPGSSRKKYERRIKDYLTGEAEVRLKDGETDLEISGEQRERAESALELGETEYSLRWLPIGGFVKMLGQEDARPGAVSDDPRSYNVCAIPKRMVVVSAGVIANVLLALALFVVAFLIGVRFEAPVVGAVSEMMPAGTTMAENAAALGVTEPGLKPGDVVTHIDGDPARTFADLRLAAAMSKPGAVIRLTVDRIGLDEPLRFAMTPRQDDFEGLLGLGIAPGSSSTLRAEDDPRLNVGELLDRAGLSEQGVQLGMRLVSAGGQPVTTYEQLKALALESGGRPVDAVWRMTDDEGAAVGEAVHAVVPVEPEFQRLRYPVLAADGTREYELGLCGMVPLTKIASVPEDSHNAGVLEAGDLLLRLGALDGPRFQELPAELSGKTGREIAVTVLRDGVARQLTAKVNRKGQLGILRGYAWDAPYVAAPFARIAVPIKGGTAAELEDTPVATLKLAPGTRIEAVDETAVDDWRSLRAALRDHTASAAAAGAGAEVRLTIVRPGAEGRAETISLALSAEDVASVHALSWESALPAYAFEPVYTTLTAEGNPLTAVSMGMQETHKMIVMTYLTIDRLFRGSVGVEQLRGPIGIVHLGATVLDKGFMWFLFFLGMISVNLAVINFLPIPIVDGGLFLFLIYEKVKGRPPSIRFQNAATVVGLCLIGALLLITFYNDIARLIR